MDLTDLMQSQVPSCCLDDFEKPRQLRVQVTGGLRDVEALLNAIRYAMGDSLNDTDWYMTFEKVKRFGDRGPLHKGTIGFIEKT